MQQLLTKHQDVIAWNLEDMPGINLEIIKHHLSVDPKAKEVRQKSQNFSFEKNTAIAVEVDLLLTTGFIWEAHYPNWLSNMVLLKKQNDKWRMCIDVANLKKACPKDSFSLLHIDLIIDSMAGRCMLNFIDVCSVYN